MTLFSGNQALQALSFLFKELTMAMKLAWKDGLNYEGSDELGHSILISNEKDEEGKRKSFSPIELVALGLGGCGGMDVISILKKKKQDVHGLEIQVNPTRVETHPRVWSAVEITYIVSGKNIDPAAVERAIYISSEKYCSVHNMLKHSVEIKHSFQIVEV